MLSAVPVVVIALLYLPWLSSLFGAIGTWRASSSTYRVNNLLLERFINGGPTSPVATITVAAETEYPMYVVMNLQVGAPLVSFGGDPTCTLSMYVGEPPVRHDVPRGGLIHIAPGTPLQSVNHGQDELLVYAYGTPPEHEHAEILDPVS